MSVTSAKLKGLIIECSEKNISSGLIEESSNLVSDFGFDSIQIVQLILGIEDVFEIIFDEEFLEPDTFSNFSRLLNVIENSMMLKERNNV